MANNDSKRFFDGSVDIDTVFLPRNGILIVRYSRQLKLRLHYLQRP